MAFFEYVDSLSSLKEAKKIEIKEGIQQESLYTFCIPTFKRSQDLKIAVDSVFSQKTAIPYNVIISDNNPERGDETEQLVLECYSDKPNLTYFKNTENLGMTGNWNRLVMECKTEYMILFHDDDLLFPYFLEELEKIRKRFLKVSALNTSKILWTGGSYSLPKNRKDKTKIHSSKTNFNRFNFGAPTGCLFRVDDLKEIGGFDPAGKQSFDYIAVEKLCLKQKVVLSTKQKLMLYRVVNNYSSKIENQLNWLTIDYQIKTELKELLGISDFIYKLVLWFEIKMRLRSIDKISPGIKYLNYSPGSRFFCLLYGLYARVMKNLY